MMRRILVCATTLLASLALALPAGTARASEGLPEITAHSELTVAVRKGDRVAFDVQATGTSLEAKWVSQQGIVCRTLSCVVDTGDWGLGTHKLTFVVVNEHGSLFLRFTVRILAAPAGYAPAKIQPDLTFTRESIEAVSADELAVRSTAGRGYSYTGEKVQVVGPLPRALDWEERLRTQPASTLTVGRDGESHVLAGESVATLVKAPSGRRVIVLESGALRSRQLDGAAPRWSILVSDFMQVDTDALGDVLVQRLDGDNQAVAVTVLRGNARVFVKAVGESADVTGAGRSIGVPAGAELVVERSVPSAARISLPVAKRVAPIIRETTPHYMPGRDLAGQAPATRIIREKQPTSLVGALIFAEEALGVNDPLRAIEALQPFESDAEESFDASLALGEAYVRIQQYEAAREYLYRAIRLDGESAAPHMLLAASYLAERQWKRAQKALADAEGHGEPDERLASYYAGVAATYAKDPVGARSRLENAVWAKGDLRVGDSARRFLRRAASTSLVDIVVYGGLVYDDNLLRLSQGARNDLAATTISLPQGADKGVGWRAGGRLGLWPYRSERGALGVIIAGEKLGWFDDALSPLALVVQSLGLHSRVAFGGNAAAVGAVQPPVVAVELGAKVETLGVGDARAIDAVSTSLTVGSPQFWNARVGINSRLNIDPLPGRDDIFDPIIEEAVAAGSERSSRQVGYTLGATPLAGTWTLDVALRPGTTRYRNEQQAADELKDFGMGLAGAYAPTSRHEFTIGFDWLTRDWITSTDGREDTRLTLDLAWRWRLTTSLSQRLRVTSEIQDSSRAANAFERKTAEAMWTLEL